MLSEEARVGKRVRSSEDHRMAGWGDPNYAALDVLPLAVI
jgi:hypothetical protein